MIVANMFSVSKATIKEKSQAVLCAVFTAPFFLAAAATKVVFFIYIFFS